MDIKNQTIQFLPTETYFTIVRQELMEKGQAYVRITGMSMWPLLHHLRDGVIIEPVRYPDKNGQYPPSNIHPGDIVLFDRKNGRYALHRVIGLKKNGFTMAGDNQWHIEKNLPYDQIVGVVTSVVRNGTQISSQNFLFKFHSHFVVFTTCPRILLKRAAEKIYRFIRPSRTVRSTKED